MKNEIKEYYSVGGLCLHHLQFSIIQNVKHQSANLVVTQNDAAHWKLDVPLMTTRV